MAEPVGPVVVGVDGTPTSLAALDLAAEEAMARVVPLVVVHAVGIEDPVGADRLAEFAFAEAALRGAPLLALHVWSVPADTGPVGTHPGVEELDRAGEEAGRILAEALACWSEKYPEVEIRTAVRHGLDVPVALSAASRSAQLVVVGATRAGRDGPRPPMGSVALAMVQRAGCPIAVIPEARR